eukprot:15089-Pleurochrysis_carterae.AAC.1
MIARREAVKALPAAHVRDVAQLALVVIAATRLAVTQVAADRCAARGGERVPYRAAELARHQVGRRVGRGEKRRHLGDGPHCGGRRRVGELARAWRRLRRSEPHHG